MSTDAPLQSPKKKPSIFWWLGGLLVVLLFAFFLQLVGPSPAIIISKQTTYITAPLWPDGLPNYEAYVLERSREGVTSDNNAAGILWSAAFPGEVGPQRYEALSTALGLPAIPTSANALVPLYKYIIGSYGRPAGNSDAAEKLYDRLATRPWTAAQYPPIDQWINNNQKPIDALLAGSQRSRFFFPSPAFLDPVPDLAFGVWVPELNALRETTRALSTRAMWHAGAHRPAESWRDLLAAHRISRLATQGPWLVDQTFSMTISNTTCDSTIAMLQETQPSVDQARQALDDLGGLPRFTGVADALEVERIMFLDTVIELKRGNVDAESLRMMEEDSRLTHIQHFRFDWNAVLRKGNEFFDRLESAARLKDHAAREQALVAIDTDIRNLDQEMTAGSWFTAAINPSARTDLLTARLVSDLLPTLKDTFATEDRANTVVDLTRLAAALAVYRAAHGDYPDKLDALVPGVLDKLPTDLFHGQPFIYQPLGAGYLLYSTGPNGRDDDGSNTALKIFKGGTLDGVDDRESATPGTDDDDISIHVPIPGGVSPAPTAQPTS